MKKASFFGDTEELFFQKLESSGLTAENAKLLGLSYLTSEQTGILDLVWGDRFATMRIAFFDVDGKTPLKDHDKAPNFYRYRRLQDSINKDEPKYLQPKDTKVHVYFPPHYAVWHDIIKNTKKTIVITEGELKAAKATVEGIPTISISGVSAYKSTKDGIKFLSELEQIEWANRQVVICFDSDIMKKEDVCTALWGLAQQLERRGAKTQILYLPVVYEDENKKTGLDDYLVVRGKDDLENLIKNETEHLTNSIELWGMNQQWCYVQKVNRVMLNGTQNFISCNDLKNTTTSCYEEKVLKKDGFISLKTVNIARPWLDWPMRKEVLDVVYEPGYPPLTNILFEGKPVYNLWKGWGCEPEYGDVTPFLMLVDHLFTDAEDGVKNHFLDWLAYPLQNPGAKMSQCYLIYGLSQGTGKSLIGYIMKKIYGDNFAEVKDDAFHKNFNYWANNKQFIMGDEITGSSNRNQRKSDRETVKKLITQEQMSINLKNQPEYEINDHMNYYFTSNQPNAFPLEEQDRRFNVHEVVVSPLSQKFYTELRDTLDHQRLGNHVFQYLLDRDYKSRLFLPHEPAKLTKAKINMIEHNLSDVYNWLRDFKNNPDDFIPAWPEINRGVTKFVYDGQDIVCARQLVQLYDPMGQKNVNESWMARELSSLNTPKVLGGKQITFDKITERYWVIKNENKWKYVTDKEVVKKYLRDWEENRPKRWNELFKRSV